LFGSPERPDVTIRTTESTLAFTTSVTLLCSGEVKANVALGTTSNRRDEIVLT
jgi:hypothetical protein